MNLYYVLGNILSIRVKAVSKVDRMSFLVELTGLWGGENKNKQNK